MKLTELARLLDCRLDVETAAIEITGVQGVEAAAPGQITFLSNPKYAPKLKTTQASAVIASQPIAGLPTVISTNPYLDFARALEILYQPPRLKPGIHPPASIAATATIGEGASIGPFVAIGENAVIRRNAVIHPTVCAQSGIGGDAPANSRVSGSPAFDASQWLRAITAFQRLPELLRSVRDLKRDVGDLKKNHE